MGLKGTYVALKSGVGRRGGVAAGACVICVGGVGALLTSVSGIGAWHGVVGRATAAGSSRVSSQVDKAAEVTIASPRPYFVPFSGQGPSLAGGRVAWTANSGQGSTGSPIDRIYLYDLAQRRLSVPVYSRYGTAGFIGDYALAGDQLAYVDTGVTPSRIFTWQVGVVDLRQRRARVVVTSPPGASSYIPPRIAFDGAHLLVLQTVIKGSNPPAPESMALLYTLARPGRKPDLLARAQSPTTSFGDPVLAGDMALWTTQSFGRRPSSRLTAYDLRRRVRHAIPVGDVSEVAANGDYIVWKSGLASAPSGGRVGLYSLHRERVLSDDLAHTSKATYPSIGGDLVSWTLADNSRVQVYSVAAGRVVHDAPPVPGRVYGLSAVAGDTTGASTSGQAGRAVSWVYTSNVLGKGPQRGYVVVREVGP